MEFYLRKDLIEIVRIGALHPLSGNCMDNLYIVK